MTCLSATLPLVNCSDYYCDNVAIKKGALHQDGRVGLMVREMDVHRLHSAVKCIKVAIHSDPPLRHLRHLRPPRCPPQSCRLLPPVLIDICSQSILLCRRKTPRKSTRARRVRARRIRRQVLMRRHPSAGSVHCLHQDTAAE